MTPKPADSFWCVNRNSRFAHLMCGQRAVPWCRHTVSGQQWSYCGLQSGDVQPALELPCCPMCMLALKKQKVA